MRIHALATDYDGTLAHHGVVAPERLSVLAALRNSGRRLLLVTGRQVDDLRRVAPDLSLFDAIVAENGAVLFDPTTQELELLGEPVAPELPAALERQGIPFDLGRAILATSVPHDVEALAAIRDLGLELQVTYNKGAVMILPAGVSKASGLRAALDRLGLSPHNVAGIGDAENDHAFLRLCEVSAAVANALPAIKERADVVLRHANGRGVATFIERDVLTDFAASPRVFARYSVELGALKRGAPLRQPVYGETALIVGASGSGKSTLTGVLIERLIDQGYQVCVVDPEGDHTGLDPLIVIGSAGAAPTLDEVTTALERVESGVVVNLVALSLAEKARFSTDLLAALLALRAARGRPHWIVLDEAHHLFPAEGAPGETVLPADADGLCLVTLRADLLSRRAIERVRRVYVVGEDATGLLQGFARARGVATAAPDASGAHLLEGEALVSRIDEAGLSRPQHFRVAARRSEHRRHVRKYVGGDLGDSSFYFRGPEHRLNLRAYNVQAFIEMARGVDIATWRYHADRGEIEAWFRDKVKDPQLADDLARIAHDYADRPEQARSEALRAIEARYTAGG